MHISVIGSGYVGLVTSASFSEFGVGVTCVDKVEDKIKRLQAGDIPIYEPGLADLVSRNVRSGRLTFASDVDAAVRDALVIFIAVGTPPLEDGSTDLSHIEEVARQIGRNLDEHKIVVTKSTVPPGTSAMIRAWIEEEIEPKGPGISFSVVSNPEFLREGSAVSDFLRPDRVVIGVEEGDDRALEVMKNLYRPLFLNEIPFVITSLVTSELSKYAANAFLAAKISFINEIAIICNEVGGDVQDVATAMGLDKRVGSQFLHAGPGYGGSCFPKDTRSAAFFARSLGLRFRIVEALIEVNERQRSFVVEKLLAACGDDVSGKTIAVLGLSFKPETDDVRDAPAIHIIESLLDQGARVRAYDPRAMESVREILPDVMLCRDAYHACEGADVLAIVTEWNEFRALDLLRIRGLLKEPKLVDMRNVYDPMTVRALGFEYWSIGRP